MDDKNLNFNLKCMTIDGLQEIKPTHQFINVFTYIFSRTMPLACDAPENGLDFQRVPKCDFLYCLSFQRCSRR